MLSTKKRWAGTATAPAEEVVRVLHGLHGDVRVLRVLREDVRVLKHEGVYDLMWDVRALIHEGVYDVLGVCLRGALRRLYATLWRRTCSRMVR